MTVRPLLTVVAAVLGLAGCSDDETRATGSLGGTVTVLAAASLTGSFAEIAEAFEQEHPGVDLQLSFDGSSRLATAIIEGAPADVFASADSMSLAKVTDAERTVGAPVTFATNLIQIVVPAGNPLGIGSLADLTAPGVRLALCGAEVPCGRYAAEAFEHSRLVVPPASAQESVKGVVTQVQLGEADAGIVYRTDVLAADGVEGVEIPPDQQVEPTYPAAMLADASNPEAAAAFLAFLIGEPAQAILERFGFGLP